MLEEKLLKRFGLDQRPNDIYIPEYLINYNQEYCFFIDKIPYIVNTENGYKLKQLHFSDIKKENTFEIVKKLWLYNEVYIHSEMLLEKDTLKRIKKLFPLLYLKHKDDILLLNAESIKKMDFLKFLWKLSELNIIDLTLVFDEWSILLTPTWESYFVYINNNEYLECVKKIVTTEGLYLRGFYSNIGENKI